mgnify:CR=1 FL=1
MKTFFLKLLGSNTGTSSRRFIALLMLPSYITGVFVGIFSKDFDFFLTSMISCCIPIFIAYFSLSWQNIKEIFIKFKHEKNTEITNI